MKYQRQNRNSLAQIMRTRQRYLWVSAPIDYVKDGSLTKPVVRKGETFNVGRNAAKRVVRAYRAERLARH